MFHVIILTICEHGGFFSSGGISFRSESHDSNMLPGIFGWSKNDKALILITSFASILREQYGYCSRLATVVGRFSEVVTAFKLGWNKRDSIGWSISIRYL